MYTKRLPFTLACLLAACSTNKSDAGAPTATVTTPSETPGGVTTTTPGGSTTGANAWPACATSGVMAAPATGAVAATCTTAGAATANVVVDVTQGPKGVATPFAITNALYSMGIDDGTRDDYVPSLNAKFVAYLKALHPGMLRFPAGYNGQQSTWGTTDGFRKMTPALVDQFIALCRAVGAEPYLAVNLETAPMSEAIAMLTYVNKTKGYNVKWWQIGNEPNLPGEWPDESPTAYPARFLQYRNAMLAVDPTIKFVGLESYTGEGILGQQSEIDWFKPFLAGIGTGQVDAIAWHYYPLYSSANSANSTSSATPSVAHLLQENATDWPPAALNFADKIIPYMRDNMAQKVPKAQIWIDEFAEDSGTALNATGYGDTMVGALWAADAMGRYADQGVEAIFHFIFKAVSKKPEETFGYTLLDPNNQPRPEYYTFWLLANHFGDTMVNAISDQNPKVAAHAALRAEDCSLRVLLVNKSTVAQNVRLTLKGYAPASAGQYNLVGTGYQTKDVKLNGTTLNDSNIGAGDAAIAAVSAPACADNTVTLQPYSVNILIFKKT